jgi:hypothetical protein
VYSLGASLYAAVEGHPPFGTDPGNVLALLARIGRGQAPPPRNAGRLTDLLRGLVADDPAHRPTAAQAHHALRHAASPPWAAAPTLVGPGPDRPVAAERPRRRGRLVAAVTGVLAAVAAGIVAVVVDGGRTGGAETASPSGPVAAAATGAPQITIDDPQTADPCSLVETAALKDHGLAYIDRNNVRFAGCRFDITRPGRSSMILTAAFRSPAELVLPIGAARESLDGRDVYRPAPTDTSCARRVVLSARNAIDIVVGPDGGGPADDMCEIAESAARATVAALADGVIGTRARVDETTALGGTSACSLLQPADLAIVPGLRSPIRGFGDWECSWDDGAPSPTEVILTFYLGYPLDESDGTPTDIAGRPGSVLATEDGCWVQFVQHDYTEESRIEEVWLMVLEPGRGADACGAATALATAAASRLPPPT